MILPYKKNYKSKEGSAKFAHMQINSFHKKNMLLQYVSVVRRVLKMDAWQKKKLHCFIMQTEMKLTNVLNTLETSIDLTHWKGIQGFKDASAIEESCAPCNMHVYPPSTW